MTWYEIGACLALGVLLAHVEDVWQWVKELR